jgi:hypothetical protein
MRRAAFLIILLPLLLCSWSLAQDKAPGFAGKWLRDDVVTRNGNHLPRETWEITLGERTVSRRVFSEHSENVPTFVYNLDGTDASMDVPDCYGRHRILRLKKIQSKEIEVTEILPGCGSSTSGGMFIAEIWKLTNEGNTLSTVRKFRSADPKIQIRNIDQKYSFQKVPPSSDH